MHEEFLLLGQICAISAIKQIVDKTSIIFDETLLWINLLVSPARSSLSPTLL